MIRLGIIGCGGIAMLHAENILGGKCPEIRVTAAADRREVRRDWAREKFPDAAIYNEGSDLIADAKCDAVLIATPHYQHPTLAVEALERGLHVMSEKPAGVYTLQVRDMIAAADRHPELTFALMYNQRTNCVYRKAKALLDAGELGQMKRVNWIITDWYRAQSYYDAGAWRATWDGEGGGVLLNQCPHQLDLLIWLCGMPTAVRARCGDGRWHNIEVEDDVTAMLEFEGGASGVFVASTGDFPGTNRLEISGEYGKLVCEDGAIRLWRLDQSERELCFSTPDPWPHPPIEEKSIPAAGPGEQHVGVINAFAAHLLRGEPLIASAEDGLNAIRLSNAIHLSAWTGERIELPADGARFEALLDERIRRSAGKRCADVTYDTDHRGTGASLGG